MTVCACADMGLLKVKFGSVGLRRAGALRRLRARDALSPLRTTLPRALEKRKLRGPWTVGRLGVQHLGSGLDRVGEDAQGVGRRVAGRKGHCTRGVRLSVHLCRRTPPRVNCSYYCKILSACTGQILPASQNDFQPGEPGTEPEGLAPLGPCYLLLC